MYDYIYFAQSRVFSDPSYAGHTSGNHSSSSSPTYSPYAHIAHLLPFPIFAALSVSPAAAVRIREPQEQSSPSFRFLVLLLVHTPETLLSPGFGTLQLQKLSDKYPTIVAPRTFRNQRSSPVQRTSEPALVA